MIKTAASTLPILKRRDMVISPCTGAENGNISPSARTLWACSLKPRIALQVANESSQAQSVNEPMEEHFRAHRSTSAVLTELLWDVY
jgi:hypothetical protein